MMSVRIFVALFLILLLAFTAAAQSPGTQAADNPQEKEKAQRELERKALAMLEEVMTDGEAFRLPENRIRVALIAADLLWRYDQRRAGKLLQEAMNTFTQMMSQPDDASGRIRPDLRWQLHQLRQEIIQKCAAHDPQLASDFLLATRPLMNQREGGRNPDTETQMELMLAQETAATDPKRALQMAEEKLAAGKDPAQVSGVLYKLREKDQAAAQKLTDAIVARLRADAQLSHESAYFALNLLNLAPPPQNGDDAQADNAQPLKPLLSAAAARELIEKVTATVQAELAAAKQQNDPSRNSNAYNLLSNMQAVMPYIEKYAPSSVDVVKRNLDRVEQLVNPQQRAWNDFNKLAEKGSVDALLEAAQKAMPEMQYNFYQRAAQMAAEQGNAGRARQIISDHVTDFWQQRQALLQIDQQLLWRAISENRYAEARQMLARLPGVQERVSLLMQLSASAQSSGKKELASDLLDEAWAIVSGPAESGQQMNAQLQLAFAYLKLSPARSLEIIEATIDQYNELVSAIALIENFEQQGTFREKEMILNNGGRLSGYLYQYTQSLSELARTDFDRVHSLLSRFARPEIRTLIRLSILQRLLHGQPGNEGISIISGRIYRQLY